MKERINPEEFAKFLDNVLITDLMTAVELHQITGINRTTISKARHGAGRRPDEESQRKILIGIMEILDAKWNTFTGEEKEQAGKIYDQCSKYIYEDELNDPELSEEDYQYLYTEMAEDRLQHAYGVSESVEKTLQELMKLEPGKLRWLYRYYGSIHKYFVNDLLAIKQGIYPKDFVENENSITVSQDMFIGDGLKKTLNCFFFSRHACENTFFSTHELSDEENKKIRSFFEKQITEYIICCNNMAFDEFDPYLGCILDEVEKSQGPEDFVYMEYLPYNFLSDVNLMLSITSKEWFRYGAFRLYMNKEWEKNHQEFSDFE